MAKSGFKMKGSPMQRNFGIGSPMRDEKKKKDDSSELVTYTDPNYQANWGGSPNSSYETLITKGEKRLRDAGASEEVIKNYLKKNKRN